MRASGSLLEDVRIATGRAVCFRCLAAHAGRPLSRYRRRLSMHAEDRPDAADEGDLVGALIGGRYRVERKIGAGGMGTVWCVCHEESLQRYAMKTLHPKAAGDRMSVERFLHEARATASLQSRNVVKIVDVQVTYVDPTRKRPMPFLVMELLTGSTLERLIEHRGR